jgi:hypothetical protein
MAERAGNKNEKQKKVKEKEKCGKKEYENYRRGKEEAGHRRVANKRRSGRKNVQLQPGKRCSHLVEMKRLDEVYERGAAASRQRGAIHGGVMKDEKQRREYEWVVHSSPECEEKNEGL